MTTESLPHGGWVALDAPPGEDVSTWYTFQHVSDPLFSQVCIRDEGSAKEFADRFGLQMFACMTCRNAYIIYHGSDG